MFRGFSGLNVDAKGRLAIPARYRDALLEGFENALVLTLNPWDRCLWLYPLSHWDAIDAKLQALSDFDRESRRTKQIIRGYASDCALDSQGRVLLPGELREFAGISKRVAFLGQGNKFEIWDEGAWTAQRDEWLDNVGGRDAQVSDLLGTLAL